jgi:predicted DCC family thiol-disulfide oxidoreductase YuxK
MPSTSRHILVYDAECGPCSKFKRALDWLDKYNRLDYVSLTSADEIGLLDSIPISRRHRSFHLISPEGISSGSEALPRLISLLPLGKFAASVVRRVPHGLYVMAFLYDTAARLHDVGACSSVRLLQIRSRKASREISYASEQARLHNL